MFLLPPPRPPPPATPLHAPWLAAMLLGNGTLGDGGGGGSGGGGDGPGGEMPSNWSSLIGIVTAIVGNVLIALALNVQRYAHLRLHEEQRRNRARARRALKHAAGGRPGGYGSIVHDRGSGRPPDEEHDAAGYDADDDAGPAHETEPLTARFRRQQQPSGHPPWPESGEGRKSTSSGESSSGSESDADGLLLAPAPPTSYLRSPYWWLGQMLITVGEMGNFLAYGFAPASIVSPLGVVALISNCVIAPMLFKERFRTRDFGGVVVAMAGAVTVVLSAKQEETKLNPHDVWDAITTPAFEIYAAVTGALMALLMWASPRYGHRTILIDLGLVGLFGAYTVLATKGVSSMLSSTLLGAFVTPMTYGLVLVLLATAVMQVRYVNKALQRFDSTQVIPIQFVTFTLSVIVGSAVLYRDFERTTPQQAVKFVGGCLLTFSGVFIITSGRPPADDAEDVEDLEDLEGAEDAEGAENVDEGGSIGLAQHADDRRLLLPPPPPPPPPRGSRRSSRSTVRGSLRPALSTDTGVPSPRIPVGAAGNDRAESDLDDDDSGDDGGNPWRSAPSSMPPGSGAGSLAPTLRPGLGPAPVSADSVLQTTTSTLVAVAAANRPVTPSTSLRPPPTTSTFFYHQLHHHYHHHHHHHPPSPMISPSPLLSSTMSAVVADTILKHMDGAGGGGGGAGSIGLGDGALLRQTARRPSTRRVRPGLRSSLFVPQDELLQLDDVEDRQEGPPPPRLHTSAGYPQQRGGGGGGGGSSAEVLGTASGSGLRGRARSLSTAFGGLFRSRQRSHAGDEGERRRSDNPPPHDDGPPPAEGVAGPASRPVSSRR